MGQTTITAGFYVLLMISVLSANRVMNESEKASYEGEALNIASDVALMLMNEAQRKSFDLNADPDGDGYQSASEFTSPSSLGPAGSESFAPWPDVAPFQSATRYNDFDDYNGYQRKVSAGGISGFVVSVQVYYVDPVTLSKASKRTYVKGMDVTVEHPVYLPNKITFSTTLAY